MQERRKQLGGYMPVRKVRATPLKPVSEALFEEFYKGTEGREASTTMVSCACFRSCCAIQKLVP